ncbi:MAG: glycosyltransferase [Alishewanella aestuarii]
MAEPLVTVYITTRNRPQLFLRALQSVALQSYKATEIIVVDDNSSPDNAKMNASYCERYAHVRYFWLSDNQGAPAARNFAIASAQGEYITGLDDDDEFTTDRLEVFVAAWQAAPDFSLLCSGYIYYLPDGRCIVSKKRRKLISVEQIRSVNYVGNQIFTKTSYLKAINGFDPTLVACQDYDVWIRLINRFGSGLRLPVNSYIVHQEHETPRISTQERRYAGHQQLIEKHRAMLSKNELRSQMFYQALLSGETNFLRLLKLAGTQNTLQLLKSRLSTLLSRKVARK